MTLTNNEQIIYKDWSVLYGFTAALKPLFPVAFCRTSSSKNAVNNNVYRNNDIGQKGDIHSIAHMIRNVLLFIDHFYDL